MPAACTVIWIGGEEMRKLRGTNSALITMAFMLAGCGGQKPMTPVMPSGTTATIDLRPEVSSAAITTFALPGTFSRPANILTGPDQALWFTESGRIARLTVAGGLREFALPAGHTASS